MKNRITACLIALFLGGIGGQWFYLGKPVNGVLSVLFFWTGVPALVAIYHVIVFAFMSDTAFATKYDYK